MVTFVRIRISFIGMQVDFFIGISVEKHYKKDILNMFKNNGDCRILRIVLIGIQLWKTSTAYKYIVEW
jgi:hypothetical protein